MELYQLRIFAVVAAEGNVTRAAKRLFTTPPSVSAHIKALEAEWGVTLFERSSRGMSLTETGRRLLAKAEATLAAAQDLANHANVLQGELIGTVKVGLNASAEFLRIPEALAALRERSPGIEVHLDLSSTGRIIERLKSGVLDAGFLYGPVPEGFNAERLTEVSLVVAGPVSFGARLKVADWSALSRLPWVCSDYYCPFPDLVEAQLDQLGLTMERAVCTDDDGTKADLVRAGLGVALLEKTEAQALEAECVVLIAGRLSPLDCSLAFANRAGDEDPLVAAVSRAVSSAWS
ncbi:MAG: LysR family transcriptional regulator [Pseudomonadota bacterium]